MDRGARMRTALSQVAPGTDLREGLERILRGRTGGLIVLGNDDVVDQISGGGFRMDVEFSSTGLRELAKMDGAVILDRNATRILRAAVQLLPDAAIPTQETGTRHRTAERVAVQTGFPVISVSKSMETIALYYDGHRKVLEDSTAILGKANQALATLERYRQRLDEVGSTLSALEVEDLVTVRDVLLVTQRLEMVRRMSAEIDEYVVELGVDGRLLDLQLREVVSGVGADQILLLRDYLLDADAYAEHDHGPRPGGGHRARGRPAVGPDNGSCQGPRRTGPAAEPPRLPSARPRATPAGCGGGTAHRSVREPAETPGGIHRRSAVRRRCR